MKIKIYMCSIIVEYLHILNISGYNWIVRALSFHWFFFYTKTGSAWLSVRRRFWTLGDTTRNEYYYFYYFDNFHDVSNSNLIRNTTIANCFVNQNHYFYVAANEKLDQLFCVSILEAISYFNNFLVYEQMVCLYTVKWHTAQILLIVLKNLE